MIAAYQEAMPDGLARCLLCPHRCVLKPGQTSRCLGRENRDGQLEVRNYGKVTSLALDPIEKKPLSAFYPGKRILSVGTFGCNLTCRFCQNWRISTRHAPTEEISPDELLRLARETVPEGNIGIAFTYNEPTIWYEYVRDTAKIAHDAGLAVVLVTNGYILEEPLKALLPFVDAVNIDLKAFTDGFYKQTCGGSLPPVLETIRNCHGKCHVEVTTLLIPGMNDSEEEISQLSSWIASISPGIPLHLSRHHPDYKMTEPEPIGVKDLHRLAVVASRHLDKVLVGNV